MTERKIDKKKERSEVKTFSVPFALEIKDNITFNKSSSKPSKEELISKAIRFHIKGNISEAIRYYQYCINEGFNDPRIYSNYGAILKDQGKLINAEIFIRKAIEINPNFFQAHLNLGLTLKELGNLKEAEISIRKAIEINPDLSEAHSNLGNIFLDLGNLLEAELSIRKAIEINPNFAEAHYNLGNLLKQLHKPGEAEISIRKAIKLNPDFAEAHSNLGNIFLDLGNLLEAEKSYRKAIIIKPDFAEAYSNLGNLLLELSKSQEAELSIRKAIEINPNFSEAHYNLGKLLKQFNKSEEAIISTRKAIELKPNSSKAHYNLGHFLLTQKNFKEGWEEYEWRWKINNLSIGKKLKTNRPEWKNGNRGRVLLWPEQGVGDEILFWSLIPDFIDYVDRLIVQTDKRLIPLLKRTYGDRIEYFSRGEYINENIYDYHIAMGSLPKILRNTLASFENSKKLKLKVDKDKSNKYRQKLIGKSNKKIVGISWKSISEEKSISNGSIPLEQLIKGIYSPNICFVSLQYGEVDQEIELIKQKYGIEINQIKEFDNFHDIDELSSLIYTCDEVVSIANITVNLSGALGIKCNTLIDVDARWRFGMKNKYCYWFPFLRLFRRINSQSWDESLNEIKKSF